MKTLVRFLKSLVYRFTKPIVTVDIYCPVQQRFHFDNQEEAIKIGAPTYEETHPAITVVTQGKGNKNVFVLQRSVLKEQETLETFSDVSIVRAKFPTVNNSAFDHNYNKLQDSIIGYLESFPKTHTLTDTDFLKIARILSESDTFMAEGITKICYRVRIYVANMEAFRQTDDFLNRQKEVTPLSPLVTRTMELLSFVPKYNLKVLYDATKDEVFKYSLPVKTLISKL